MHLKKQRRKNTCWSTRCAYDFANISFVVFNSRMSYTVCNLFVSRLKTSMSCQDKRLMKSSIYIYPKIMLHPPKAYKRGTSLSLSLAQIYTQTQRGRWSEKYTWTRTGFLFNRKLCIWLFVCLCITKLLEFCFQSQLRENNHAFNIYFILYDLQVIPLSIVCGRVS